MGSRGGRLSVESSMNDRTRIERHGFRVASVLSLLLVSACGSTPSTQKAHSSSPSAAADKGGKSDQATAFPKDLLPAELLPDLPLVAPQSDLDIPVFSD